MPALPLFLSGRRVTLSLLLLAVLAMLLLPIVARAQQTPYAPGDWQGRTIILQSSTVQALNFDTETQNGVVTAGAFGQSVYQPGVTATGNNLAGCYNLTTSPGYATTLISGGAAGTGVCISGNIVYGGWMTIVNADTNFHLLYPNSSSNSFDALAAGAPLVLPPNGTVTMQRIAATLPWRTIATNVQSYTAQASWRTTDTVANGTSILVYTSPWQGATVESVAYGDATGTFTAAVQVAPTTGGTPASVTGCSALSVTSTPATATCTTTALPAGGELTVVVSAAASTPNGASVQVSGHRTIVN